MAKSSSFFGLRRGSTKSLTFQVLDGQQITKDRVTEVRNPQTQKQQIQRVLMLTALNGYSAMKEIVDHSFEGVSYGGKTQQAWMAENLRAIRTRLSQAGNNYASKKAFVPIGQKFLAPNYYIMSKGSLPSVPCKVAGDFQFLGGESYAEVINALKAQPGDQLTICIITGDADYTANRFHFCRIILQPQNADGSNASLSAPFFTSEGLINLPNKRNENTEGFKFDLGLDEYIGVAFGFETILAGTVILSREVDRKWLRSSQALAVAASHPGFTLQEAIDSSASDVQVDSSYFLNGASDADNIAPAVVDYVRFGQVEVSDGAVLDGAGSLVVVGSGLSAANVKLIVGGNVWVPESASDSQITYAVASNGSFVLFVNNIRQLSFTVKGNVPVANFSKLVADDRQMSSIPSNIEVAINHALNVAVEGTDFDPSKFVVLGTGNTVSTGSSSSTAWNGVITCKAAGQLQYNGQTILAWQIAESGGPIM